LYGLKQAPRAWYGRLRGFLFSKGFEMGKVNKTLFLLRQGDDILIAQVYVDDIVFGGSSHSLVAKDCRGHEQRIRDLYHGRIAVISWASDQVGEGGNFCASSQLHKGLEAPINTDEYDYSAGCRRGWRALGPKGVPEHDQLPLVLDGDKEGHCDNPPRKISYYRLNQSPLVIKR
jgi:hypothetical protein